MHTPSVLCRPGLALLLLTAACTPKGETAPSRDSTTAAAAPVTAPGDTLARTPVAPSPTSDTVRRSQPLGADGQPLPPPPGPNATHIPPTDGP